MWEVQHMPLEIEINGSATPEARYIAYAPSPCRIRQTPAAGPLPVTLASQPAQPGGGQAVFYSNPATPSSATLQLTLPADGSWVDFGLGGKWQAPSVDDRDCLLIATGNGDTLTVPLMVRLRKDANTLLPRERDRFLEALAKLNAGGSGRYQDFRDIHVAAANAEEHAGPHFLPWHRTLLLDFERGLQAIDSAVSLHYWRFDQPASSVFQSNFMGATAQVTLDDPPSDVAFDSGHPLSGWITDGVPGISRSALFDTQTSQAPGPPGFDLLSEAATLALGDVYTDFAQMEGTPHGAAHVSFVGSLSQIPTAAKDPLFFMLHANVDRLWALWQWLKRRTDPNDVNVYQGQDRDGRRLDDSTWPWNGVTTSPRPDFAPGGPLKPSPTTAAPGAAPTIRGVIDYQGNSSAAARIGYGYDAVPFELS
jgi:tyrosinase